MDMRQKLQKLLLEGRWNDRALAKAIGAPYTSVRRLIKTPQETIDEAIARIVKIAEKLDADPGWLIDDARGWEEREARRVTRSDLRAVQNLQRQAEDLAATMRELGDAMKPEGGKSPGSRPRSKP